jgi:hypothetical protein
MTLTGKRRFTVFAREHQMAISNSNELPSALLVVRKHSTGKLVQSD